MCAKVFAAVACATLGAALVAAEAKKPQAKVEILADRAEGLYATNDDVTFAVKVTNPDGSPATNGTIEVRVTNWGGRTLKFDKVDLATQQKAYSVKKSLDEPGFLRCYAFYFAPGQKDGIFQDCAVACSPRQIRNVTERPKDFDAFWDKAIADLDKNVPADVRCEKDPRTSTKTHTCFRLSCATYGENRRTYGFLAVPNSAVQPSTSNLQPKFPVRLTVPGAGPGVYWPTPQEGVITLTMNVFDFEPGWHVHDWEVHYKRYHEMHRRWGAKFGVREAWTAGFGSKVEDTFYYGAILGVNRLVNWLCAQPYVDRTDVTYSGQSQGGAFGIFLSSLNTNLTAATISEPALTGLTMHKANRNDGWPNPYNAHTNEAAKAVVEKVAPYLDGVNFTPRIKCRVRFGVGFIDNLCPPHCVYAAYNALGPDVDRRMTDGMGVGHGGPKETYEPFDQRLKDSWKTKGEVRSDANDRD